MAGHGKVYHLKILDETDIIAVLRVEDAVCLEQVARIIYEKSQAFIDGLAGKLRERMIHLRVVLNVFVGGGTLLLRRCIEDSDKIDNSSFIRI